MLDRGRRWGRNGEPLFDDLARFNRDHGSEIMVKAIGNSNVGGGYFCKSDLLAAHDVEEERDVIVVVEGALTITGSRSGSISPWELGACQRDVVQLHSSSIIFSTWRQLEEGRDGATATKRVKRQLGVCSAHCISRLGEIILKFKQPVAKALGDAI